MLVLKLFFLHRICHDSDMFRSILIIYRDLLSFSKAYIKVDGILYIKNFNAFNKTSMFYICFTEVKQNPEDDQDRSKHVRVMTNCV